MYLISDGEKHPVRGWTGRLQLTWVRGSDLISEVFRRRLRTAWDLLGEVFLWATVRRQRKTLVELLELAVEHQCSRQAGVWALVADQLERDSAMGSGVMARDARTDRFEKLVNIDDAARLSAAQRGMEDEISHAIRAHLWRHVVNRALRGSTTRLDYMLRWVKFGDLPDHVFVTGPNTRERRWAWNSPVAQRLIASIGLQFADRLRRGEIEWDEAVREIKGRLDEQDVSLNTLLSVRERAFALIRGIRAVAGHQDGWEEADSLVQMVMDHVGTKSQSVESDSGPMEGIEYGEE